MLFPKLLLTAYACATPIPDLVPQKYEIGTNSLNLDPTFLGKDGNLVKFSEVAKKHNPPDTALSGAWLGLGEPRQPVLARHRPLLHQHLRRHHRHLPGHHLGLPGD